VAKYRHPNDDTWLSWLGDIGKWPEQVRDIGEEYAGVTCYRVKKAHVWIQNYSWNIPVEGEPTVWCDVLQGRDSIFPGLSIQRVNVKELSHCDCGKWMPPTKEQCEQAEARYKQAVMRARRVLN